MGQENNNRSNAAAFFVLKLKAQPSISVESNVVIDKTAALIPTMARKRTCQRSI